MSSARNNAKAIKKQYEKSIDEYKITHIMKRLESGEEPYITHPSLSKAEMKKLRKNGYYVYKDAYYPHHYYVSLYPRNCCCVII